MNLVKAELSRFFSRRFIQIMLVVLAAAFAVTVMTVISESETPDARQWQNAQVQAEKARQSRTLRYSSCLKLQQDLRGVDSADAPRSCEHFDPGRVRPENYLWGVFNFSREIEPLVTLLGMFLACFGFLVTASFVGSELQSGGMTNLLLWRPNRMAVQGAKLGVAIGSVTAISVVTTGLYVGTFYAIADTTGWVGEVYSTFWSELFWLCVRAVAMGIITGLIAFALAVIGRHTAAALGALIAYVVVWEIGARIVVGALNTTYDGQRNAESWFLSQYLFSWLAGPQDRRSIYDTLPVTWADSATALAVVGGLSIAAAFALFRRRDLT